MNQQSQGFVLFAVMVVIMIIALFSAMLLRADMVNSRWARVGMTHDLNTLKAKAWLAANVESNPGQGQSCVVSGVSPEALLHQSNAWWQAHACTTPDGMMVLREPPVVSDTAVIPLPACTVAAAYWHITLRFAPLGAPPLVLQALVAGPTNACLPQAAGKVVVTPGTQELAVLND